MAEPAQTIIATRAAQMFPTLSSAQVGRLRRFGQVRTYRQGEALVQVGDVRSSSVKRVASAVGDGAQVVASLHACFAKPAAATAAALEVA